LGEAPSLVDVDWHRGAFDLPQADGFGVDQPLGQCLGRGGHVHRAGWRQLLHARGNVDSRSNNVDLEAEVGRDGAIEDDVRVDADADEVSHASVTQVALHADGGQAGPDGMVFIRDGRSKYREHAVAQAPAKSSCVPAYLPDHDLKRRLEVSGGGFRIQRFDGGGRAFDVGKQDRDTFDFADIGRLTGGATMEGRKSLAASRTEPVARRIAEAAGRAGNAERRPATRAKAGSVLVAAITDWTTHLCPPMSGRHCSEAPDAASRSEAHLISTR
jgi:hypothetical protein